MIQSPPLSFKNIALNYLCLYAIFYPAIANFFMNHSNGAGGTFCVQIFQILMLAATFTLWRFRTKVRYLGEYVDVWALGVLYFTAEAIYFALFYSRFQPMAELIFAARFLFWFLFAFIFTKIDFSINYLKRLARSFWLGTVVQIAISITYWALGNVASTYDEVYATTGSAEVSGKTVVSFVVLGSVASAYWFLTEKKWDFIYASVAFLGAFVVLISYNRASQLALFTIYLYGMIITLRKRYYRVAASMFLFFLAGIAFFLSSNGIQYLLRWQNVVDDGGSGRAQLIGVAALNFVNPSSSSAFWFGEGMCKMQRRMFEACGNRIGAHNDFFDMLMVYGLIGGVFYVWIAWKLWTRAKKIHRKFPERTIIRATTLFILLTGLFTGMFQATYVFVMLISLHQYFYRVGMEKTLQLYAANRPIKLYFFEDEQGASEKSKEAPNLSKTGKENLAVWKKE